MPEPAIVTVLTASCPTVNVPVLSNTTVSMLRMVSSARYPLIKIPSCAPRPEATIMAVGVASPSAHGHAITNTPSVTENARSAPAPLTSQAAPASPAMTKTTGTNTPAMWSARRWARAFCVWACSTRRTIAANWVSAPTAVASMTRRPSITTVPPTTEAAG
ncbi:Uncharacterised protein [Mycobacterium tuberculosis]|nr:Uncharacterised protein [Mycobacterium tuberculosis]